MATHTFDWYVYETEHRAEITELLEQFEHVPMSDELREKIARELQNFEFKLVMGYDDETGNLTVLSCK